MLDNENTNGFDTNPEENQTQNEQQVNDTGNTENSENKEYENTYYSQGDKSYYSQGDNSQNSYNNYNNNYSNNYNSNYNNGNYNGNYQNNGNNGNKKKKNKLPVVIAVAAVTVLVGVSCIMGIFAVANSNSKNGKSTIDSILSQGETKEGETYNDIGSTNTNTSGSSSSGAVTVTDVSGVVDNTMPSVVAITSKTLIESNSYDSIYDYYFGGGNNRKQTYEQEAAGSGIIVDQTDTELLIVTNNHVVEGADSLKIQFDGMEASEAVDGYTKGTDANADVAVVAVKLKDIPNKTLDTIRKATLGDSDSVTVGEGVIAIGNALGYGQSVTTGIISAKDREVTIEEKKMKLLQTDAAINGGNSGGALLNSKGEVIGINVAKYSSNGSSTSSSVEGMGFAIPITSVKDIINNLETKQTRTKVSEDERGWLGISSKYDVTSDVSEAYGMPTGVYVYETVKNGPADKAGIQAGDIITAFDDQQITSYDTLKSVMAYYKSGEKVKVKIAYADGREYKEKTVTVTLASASDVGASNTQN